MIFCGCPNMTHASACANPWFRGLVRHQAILSTPVPFRHGNPSMPGHHWFCLGRSLPPPIMAQWHPYVPPSDTILPQHTMRLGSGENNQPEMPHLGALSISMAGLLFHASPSPLASPPLLGLVLSGPNVCHFRKAFHLNPFGNKCKSKPHTLPSTWLTNANLHSDLAFPCIAFTTAPPPPLEKTWRSSTDLSW